MGYILLALVGFFCGGFAMWVALETQRRRLEEKRKQQEFEARRLADGKTDISGREQKLQTDFAALTLAREEFDRRTISYKNLQDENGLVKQDLRNAAVHLRKVQLDVDAHQRLQLEIDAKVQDLGTRYLKENVKWIGNSLNPNNFVQCKQRLLDVISRCRGIGFATSPDEENGYLADLRSEYERVVRAAFQREEQARIKAQMREEHQLELERQRRIEQAKRDENMVREALAVALAKAGAEHSEEVEKLKAQLAERESNTRAISQAQLTKAGHVYVISNIGSFGENVFKIGMTRREKHEERILELGSASVPFPFDVHMMISCEDAPSLETAFHRHLKKQQVNRINPRKEFFRTDLNSIVQIVREHHGKIDFEVTVEAKAEDYRQSLVASDEELEFIDQVFEQLDDDPDEQIDSEPVPVLSGD